MPHEGYYLNEPDLLSLRQISLSDQPLVRGVDVVAELKQRLIIAIA